MAKFLQKGHAGSRPLLEKFCPQLLREKFSPPGHPRNALPPSRRPRMLTLFCHAGYEEARTSRIFNGRVAARYPDVICIAASVADVQEGVRFASERGMQMSVRSGGHNWSVLSRFRHLSTFGLSHPCTFYVASCSVITESAPPAAASSCSSLIRSSHVSSQVLMFPAGRRGAHRRRGRAICGCRRIKKARGRRSRAPWLGPGPPARSPRPLLSHWALRIHAHRRLPPRRRLRPRPGALRHVVKLHRRHHRRHAHGAGGHGGGGRGR